MKSPVLPITIAAFLIGGSSLWSQEPAAPEVPAKLALELGPDGLATKLGDESEAGLDQASAFYATAKRLQTGQTLADKDLRLVVDLDLLREASAEWLDAWYEGMYYVSGGGTMWSHFQARYPAELEDTLAVLAERMPLKPGNATPETLAQWGTLEKPIAQAKIFDEEEADDETRERWKQHKKVMLEKWERLHFEFQALDEADVQVLLKILMPSKEEIQALSGN